jgi:hypothetical protein
MKTTKSSQDILSVCRDMNQGPQVYDCKHSVTAFCNSSVVLSVCVLVNVTGNCQSPINADYICCFSSTGFGCLDYNPYN